MTLVVGAPRPKVELSVAGVQRFSRLDTLVWMSPSLGDGGATLQPALAKRQSRRKPATQSFGGYRARNRSCESRVRHASPAAELSPEGGTLCATAAGVALNVCAWR
jgi:hypothetical protein